MIYGSKQYQAVKEDDFVKRPVDDEHLILLIIQYQVYKFICKNEEKKTGKKSINC